MYSHTFDGRFQPTCGRLVVFLVLPASNFGFITCTIFPKYIQILKSQCCFFSLLRAVHPEDQKFTLVSTISHILFEIVLPLALHLPTNNSWAQFLIAKAG